MLQCADRGASLLIGTFASARGASTCNTGSNSAASREPTNLSLTIPDSLFKRTACSKPIAMPRDDHDANERTALLDEAQLPADAAAPQPVPNAGLVFALVSSIMFLLMLATPLLVTPRMAILEEVICRNFHPDVADGTDPRCKDDDVQAELSLIDGWSWAFSLLPGMIMAVPYGILADTYGRRLGFALCMIGTMSEQVGGLLICKPFYTNTFPAHGD